jgi:hypothetical protein
MRTTLNKWLLNGILLQPAFHETTALYTMDAAPGAPVSFQSLIIFIMFPK